MRKAPTLPSFGDAAVIACPFDLYETIRNTSPAFWSDEVGMYLVTGYDDVREVLRDAVTYSNECFAELRASGVSKNESARQVLAGTVPYVPTLSEIDDPVHARHARLVKSFLTPRYLRSIAGLISAIFEELLDGVTPGRTVDFVKDISTIFTISVMCEFVGVPRADHEVFEKGSDAEVILIGSMADEQTMVKAARDWADELNYIGDTVEARRGEPSDDLITHILATQPSAGEAPLTLPEMVALVKTAILAGNETTRGLIGSAVLQLARQPELIPGLRTDPSAVDKLIEETLRLQSPVQWLYRVTTRDTQIGGVPIAKGSLVAVSYAAANSDPAVFRCPAEFDLSRERSRPHMAFGSGAHFCLGSQLARLEAQIVLRALADRYESWAVAGIPVYSPSFMVRNLIELPIQFGPIRKQAVQ
jgi:cytochrome P450